MYDMGENWRDQTNQDLALLDEEFLATLSEQKDRQIYARIIALDINENPIDQIEGRVTGGSISLDGSSTIRRTCSLSMVSDQIDINDFYWGIKTKFKLSIGLQNNLFGEFAYRDNGKYPKIVWFPQGIFVISSFNTSISTNNTSISISGKDKMSLLNGDLGGQLFASIDFGTEEEKIKIMEPVGTLDDTSSETLMAKEYYFEPEDSPQLPELILATDETYVFISDNNGNYYKDGNLYRHRNGVIISGYSYYKMYKQVLFPGELFEDYTSGLAKRFIKKDENSQLYLANNSGGYALRQLYTLGYEITIKHIPIEKIIRESVHAYAGEPYHNIIINDLEDYGLEQLSYRGDKVLLAFRNCATGNFVNMQFADNFIKAQGSWDFQFNDNNTDIEGVKKNGQTISFDWDNLSAERTSITGTILKINDSDYTIVSENEYNLYNEEQKNSCRTLAKITFGMDIGYRLTDLTYSGDLISNVGDVLTSVLDKIKTMLGDFEYFYDINGRFIFQRKPVYVNTSWSQLTKTEDESYVSYGNDKKKFSFNFEGNRLISAIQISPVLNHLRNDFVVWGKRKGISGADIPIHARYAIDKKPVYYKALNNEIYTTDIRYAYEQIPDFQPKTYQSVHSQIEEILDQLQNFQFSHPIPDDLYLASPVRKSNGYGWEPGWWDIRDWAAYYKIVTQTNENPNGTMKFYSSNDGNGCIQVGRLIQDGVPIPEQYANYYSNAHVWLIEVRNNRLNLGHGIGVYNENNTYECTYYTSTLDSTRHVVSTEPTEQKERFHFPYAGCADTHTYLYFLNEIERGVDSAVYFYNPAFPFGATEEETIISHIEKDAYNDIKKYHIHIVDWREVIYQMALDFFAGQGCSANNPIYTWVDVENGAIGERVPEICCTDPDHFLYEVGQRNPYYYPTGYTGYEQYYTDLQGFWRQLYNPEYIPEIIYSKGEYKTTTRKSDESQYYIKEKTWQNSEISDIKIDYYFYNEDDHIQAQMNSEDILRSFANEDESQLNQLTPIQFNYFNFKVSGDDFWNQTDKGRRLYWNRAVFESPETLNFWFDFLDSDTELASFSVKTVGDRTKVVNNDKSSAIFYKEVPGLILYDLSETKNQNNNTVVDITKLRRQITENSGYTFVYLPKGFSQYLTISYRGASVKDKIDELLYQFSYCIENISITAMPIYFIEPNTRIYVQDKKTNIEGEYIVSKITIPLTYNGTMSISASKAPERLY